MINQYSIWKNLMIVIVIAIGTLYALPNLYGDDPSVQISMRGTPMDELAAENVENVLKQGLFKGYRFEFQNGRVLIRFTDTEKQIKARDYLKDNLDKKHIIALNLAPATPEWLRSLNAEPMYLGLDLRGGVHFLMQVDMDAAVKQVMTGYLSDFKTYLREEKLRYKRVTRSGNTVTVSFIKQEIMTAALPKLEKKYTDLIFTIPNEGVLEITANMTEVAIKAEKKSALEQNIITLRNRVNELGVAEPIIQQQGTDGIVVQLPGIQDTAKAKEILGATATLEFRLAQGSYADWANAGASGKVPFNARLYKQRDGSPVLLKRSVIVTGDMIKSAKAGFDGQSGSPNVSINLDGKGAKRMQRISSDNIGKPMGVIFIETRIDRKMVDGVEVKSSRKVEEVINVATIRDVLSHRFQITGLGVNEASNLALLLRAGALKAPVEIVEERTVGPSLGKDNIKQGFNSVIIGFAFVLIFMVLYYRGFGLIADIALTANLVLLISLLSMFQATLTLPGIAGIVLTVGMAVDANVLIFERIREELRNNNSIQASIHAGYEKAFSTIADANITTLIAAIVLFSFGTGAIKGFAITLSLGILTSMFTSIIGTRMLVNLVYGGKKIKKLSI